MLSGLYILSTDSFHKIYRQSERNEINKLVDVYAPQQTSESVKTNPAVLQQMEILFSGWGAPVLDEKFLSAAPNLKAVFYGVGSIRGAVTDAFWEHDILITSAYDSTVGIVSLGMIGRRICKLLKPFDLKIIAHDPFVTSELAAGLDAELCPLEEIFQKADVWENTWWMN